MKQHWGHDSPRLGENRRRAFLNLVTQILADFEIFEHKEGEWSSVQFEEVSEYSLYLYLIGDEM